MGVGMLLSLLTHKTELIVRGAYGAGKTQCIALLAAFFALRGHQVYYAVRENTIVAMATFVQQLLPRAPDNEWPDAIRLLSQPQARTSGGTPLDPRDTDRNPNVWHGKLVLATTAPPGTISAQVPPTPWEVPKRPAASFPRTPDPAQDLLYAHHIAQGNDIKETSEVSA